ncbi:hypothetical protein [Humibacter ginsenosidimutans]|uniref:DUF4386 family protein n=1 Tax=Humibacter ginsenosidimutans TaxID=2599293 RepID=A0A5B8M5J4_9MICO|nr:hypothetical protein [Humibacter ginsenosidimutans]QDZ15887.1 hypothetical protein FPZ11_14890 [Humibacter ginsenosidimutans]
MTDQAHGDTPIRRPDGPPAGVLALIVLVFTIASVVAYAAGSAFWTGFFAFAASIPLGIYAATIYARQLRLGIRVPGPGISFFGGISASVMLGVSGLLGWAQSRVDGLSPAVSRLVREVAFVLGGVGFVCGLGLLIAGIAVPAVILRLVPRWLAWAGLVLGALGEIAFLALLWDGLDVLLPIVRFLGLAWLAAMGFLLPRNRHDVERRTPRASR